MPKKLYKAEQMYVPEVIKKVEVRKEKKYYKFEIIKNEYYNNTAIRITKGWINKDERTVDRKYKIYIPIEFANQLFCTPNLIGKMVNEYFNSEKNKVQEDTSRTFYKWLSEWHFT